MWMYIYRRTHSNKTEFSGKYLYFFRKNEILLYICTDIVAQRIAIIRLVFHIRCFIWRERCGSYVRTQILIHTCARTMCFKVVAATKSDSKMHSVFTKNVIDPKKINIDVDFVHNGEHTIFLMNKSLIIFKMSFKYTCISSSN